MINQISTRLRNTCRLLFCLQHQSHVHFCKKLNNDFSRQSIQTFSQKHKSLIEASPRFNHSMEINEKLPTIANKKRISILFLPYSSLSYTQIDIDLAPSSSQKNKN